MDPLPWRRLQWGRYDAESMGILTKVLFFPVTGPVAGIRWTLGKVQHVVEEELTDDTPIKQELMELQMQLELGDIDDAEYAAAEKRRSCSGFATSGAWREKLGDVDPRGSGAGRARLRPRSDVAERRFFACGCRAPS